MTEQNDDYAALCSRLESMAGDMIGNWDGELDSYAETVFDAVAALKLLSRETVNVDRASLVATAETIIRTMLHLATTKEREASTRAATAVIAAVAPALVAQGAAQERAKNYRTFTDGLEAGAEICGTLAETTYDDTDSFEAATGCEAAIMRVVREQRAEQNAIEQGTHDNEAK